MYSMIAMLIVSAAGLWRLPALRTTLHPLEMLTVWILAATLQQLSHALLIINLQYIQFNGSAVDFLTLKVEQILAAPLVTLYGVGGTLFEGTGPVRRTLACIAAFLLLNGLSYFLLTMNIVSYVHWNFVYTLIKNASLTALATGFALLFRTWLRRMEVLA